MEKSDRDETVELHKSPRSLPSDSKFRRKIILVPVHNSLLFANTDASYKKGNKVTWQLLSYGSYMSSIYNIL